jgi:hypothetical protein
MNIYKNRQSLCSALWSSDLNHLLGLKVCFKVVCKTVPRTRLIKNPITQTFEKPKNHKIASPKHENNKNQQIFIMSDSQAKLGTLRVNAYTSSWVFERFEKLDVGPRPHNHRRKWKHWLTTWPKAQRLDSLDRNLSSVTITLNSNRAKIMDSQSEIEALLNRFWTAFEALTRYAYLSRRRADFTIIII